MSLLYSILKPIVKTVVKGSSLHKEESYEEFKQASYDIQRKFKFSLPKIKGFEFRDEMMDGFHVIAGKKTGTKPDRAVVYFPGGGSRRLFTFGHCSAGACGDYSRYASGCVRCVGRY